MIEVRRIPGKGRGVFAREFIASGTVFERAPVLVMPAHEVLGTTEDTLLSHYLFEWGKKTVALALGYGSLYNHSYSPNARYEDEGRQMKSYVAVRNIEIGEEITINYNGAEDAIDPVWFDVVENQRPPRTGKQKTSGVAAIVDAGPARESRSRSKRDRTPVRKPR